MASTLASSKSPAVGNTRKRSKDVYVVVRIAQRCWAKFRKECPFALYSPFIVSLASGNLEVETFRQFVAQDVHLLNIFAHAFELAETYTQDEDEKDEINELRKTIINLHDSFVQEWGSDGFKDIALNPATSKFKDFLLATVSGKIDGVKATGELSTRSEKTKLLAYTLGAIASWMRFYAYIGNELKGFVDHNRYKKWIENYSSDSFQDFCLQTEYLLNMLSDSFTKEELNIIERLYSQGIKHEIGFFLAQPLIQKAVVPLSGEHNLEERQLMIFSDFDFVFVGDHSSTILAGMATTPESDAIQTENPILRHNFNSWRGIYDKYSEGYMQCIENMLATEKAENFNYEGLQKAFEPLSDILKHLNSEVMKAGVLKGLKLEDIKRTGESWFYQNVCMDFFQALIKNESLNADVHVLSYCWCDELIRSTLSAGGLNGLKVHANELEFEESVCTGEILGKVVSPMDKVEAFGKIIESCGKGNDKKKLLTIYIGGDLLKDDLLCLLEADIGIVVKPSTNVIEVGKHFGIKFIPLFHGVVDKQKVEGAETWKGKGGLSGILYTASSWVEIQAFFIGSRWDEAAAMSNYCKISGDHISDVYTKNQNKFPKLE